MKHSGQTVGVPGLLLIFLLFALSGYSSGETLTNDFTPPSGPGAGPGRFGPWNSRLMIARSTDGLVFTRGSRVVTDQGDVPDLVMDGNGTLYLYYTGWEVGAENNRTAVAVSPDGGETWVYKIVRFSGFESMASPVDPDVQALSDGTFRLYVTSDPHDGQGPRTYYAESTDGIQFTRKGVAFARPGKHVLDPSTLQAGSTWHLFAGGNTPGPGANWHGTSVDGRSFTFREETTFTADGKKQAVANGIAVPGGYRFYTFSHGEAPAIYSFFSEDGESWKPDAGARLTLETGTGLENYGVKDPAVVRLPDGTYLMIYATNIPGSIDSSKRRWNL